MNTDQQQFHIVRPILRAFFNAVSPTSATIDGIELISISNKIKDLKSRKFRQSIVGCSLVKNSDESRIYSFKVISVINPHIANRRCQPPKRFPFLIIDTDVNGFNSLLKSLFRCGIDEIVNRIRNDMTGCQSK